MPLFNIFWSKQEIELLIANYPTMPMQQMQKLLGGRSSKSISRRAERLGLHRTINLTPTGKDSPQWRGGKNVNCETCNKEFWHTPTRGVGKYCSHECARQAMQSEKHPNWKGGKIQIQCETCKTIVWRKPTQIERSKKQFCSRRCTEIGLSGENNHYWRGGLSFEPYPATFNRKFKQMIRERDNHTCVECGKSGKSVHHINYVKQDTNPENCVTLCVHCHVKTNGNREYWQKHFQAIMSERNRLPEHKS